MQLVWLVQSAPMRMAVEAGTVGWSSRRELDLCFGFGWSFSDGRYSSLWDPTLSNVGEPPWRGQEGRKGQSSVALFQSQSHFC